MADALGCARRRHQTKAVDVFTAWELVAIPLVGVADAVAAALLPGRWAARTRLVEVLHAE